MQTERLILNELQLSDAEFVKRLVNTPEWIRFIGDRNIKTNEDALKYVQQIIDNPNITYWVVNLKDEQHSIGIITFIKRDYLEHHDIGFAFLPEYSKKGYALEATKVVLQEVTKNPNHKQIQATTLKENSNSIHLLEKLGLRFEREIKVDDEPLCLYAISVDQVFDLER